MGITIRTNPLLLPISNTYYNSREHLFETWFFFTFFSLINRKDIFWIVTIGFKTHTHTPLKPVFHFYCCFIVCYSTDIAFILKQLDLIFHVQKIKTFHPQICIVMGIILSRGIWESGGLKSYISNESRACILFLHLILSFQERGKCVLTGEGSTTVNNQGKSNLTK